MATLLHRGPSALDAPAFERPRTAVQPKPDLFASIQTLPEPRQSERQASRRVGIFILLLLGVLALGTAASLVSPAFVLVAAAVAAVMAAMLIAFGLWVQENTL